MDEQERLSLELRLEDVLRQGLGTIPVRPFAAYNRPARVAGPTQRILSVAAAFALMIVLAVAAIGVTVALRDSRPGPSPSISPSPTPSPSSPPSASPSPALAPGTYENAVLGYRVSLPTGYRRSMSRIGTGQDDLGVDLYTLQTEQQQRDACSRDSGDMGSHSPDRDSDIRVGAVRNTAGMTAVEYVNAPRGGQPLSAQHQVQSITVGGREAVKLVQQGQVTRYVIRAGDRMYELGPTQWSFPSRLPASWLDDIASTFTVITPQPFPVPAPTPSPRDSARQLAQSLSTAFAAKDADAIARLMPSCWLMVSPMIDNAPAGGVLYRSVVLFTQGLRERFAAGDLTVTIDPTVQVQADGGRDVFFVRTVWRDPDRTTRIDLLFEELDGRWQWWFGRHYFQRADLVRGSCIPYRSPWVTDAGGC